VWLSSGGLAWGAGTQPVSAGGRQACPAAWSLCLPLCRPLLRTVLLCFKGERNSHMIDIIAEIRPCFTVSCFSGWHRKRFEIRSWDTPEKRETVKQIKNNCLIAMA
jgi:hypothetical protein